MMMNKSSAAIAIDDEQKQRGNRNQYAYRVPCHKERGFPCFLGGFLRCLAGAFCRFFRGGCAAFPCRFCVFPLDFLLLYETGKGIAAKLRVILCRRFFRLRRLAVRFQLVAAVALFDLSDTVFPHALGGFLGFVRPLNAGIVFLHGMYLVVDENPGFLRGAG